MFPAAAFDSIELAEANALLERWEHKMGPLERGNSGCEHAHALFVHGEPVGVATTSSLIREHVGGGLSYINRDNGAELSRLCASNPWACRVVLRLWREVVFPGLKRQYAISYQDKNLHTGATYRNDGWKRLAYSSSGTDSRSGRKGRQKWIWVWERKDAKEKAA
jgi:hypothetical protein